MQHLYRHFAADGTLLYVGISFNAFARLCQHRYKACWFNQIATITVINFVTRKEAKAAERIAVKAEKPKYNVVFKPISKKRAYMNRTWRLPPNCMVVRAERKCPGGPKFYDSTIINNDTGLPV